MFVGLVVLLFVIAVAMIALVCGFVIYAGRNRTAENFDERQQIDRGNAYRFSFWAGMVYNFGLMVYFIFHTGNSEWTLEPFLLFVIGILIQMCSFHIYCVMTRSALPLSTKPLSAIIGYTLAGGINLVQYIADYIPENVEGITGAGSMNLCRLLIALLFISMATLHLISFLWKEKE